MNNKKIVVTCKKGLELVVLKELKEISAKNIIEGKGFVSCDYSKEILYKSNIKLRAGIHVLLQLKEFYANSYDMLYQYSKKINWHKLFSFNKTLRIDVTGSSAIFKNSQYTTHRIKDAILDTMRKFNNNLRPSIDKENPDIHVVVYVEGKKITIYLGSSGQPLFKRGYRVEHGEAPIKEDLAAGIILLSDWDKKSDVVDPMCGSATFLIEAYMIANNIAPNLNRKFAFQNWIDYDEITFNKIKEEVKNEIKCAKINYTGFEIDKKTFLTAKKIINSLGYSEIKIYNSNFLETEKKFENSFVISNPPYGERLKTENIIELYKKLGDFLKQRCKGSSVYIFTANLEASKFIGLKTSAKIPLYNGPLEGRLLNFKIY